MEKSDDEQISKPGPIFVNPNKKYGLQIRSTATKQTIKTTANVLSAKTTVKPCIFNDDDDDDDDNEESNLKKDSKKPPVSMTTSNRLKKQTQIELEKAISEDANIFEYDSIYDKLESEKVKMNPKLKNESKEPKYIAGIMKAAAKRQMEFEKVQERKIQKEREEEGDLWSDKETFVTSAYRKKMEERQLLEEEERNQEKIEALLDVRKQKDLSGFYSNVLKMRSGEFVIHEESEKDKIAKQEEKETLNKKTDASKSAQHQKVYRTKKEESSDEEEEEAEKNKLIDEDICEEDKDEVLSDDNDEERREESENITKITKTTEIKKEPENLDEEEKTKLEIKIEIESLKQEKILAEVKQAEKVDKETKRLNMFRKRTVAEVFDAELSEYFNRKSTVLSLKNYIERD